MNNNTLRYQVGQNSTALRSSRAMQLQLLMPPRAAQVTALETKGVVYTKQWVVELLLDLAGYRPDANLVDAVAVEPAAGDGAFLGPMIERLTDSCRRLKCPLSDCRSALVAYELDDTSAERARNLAISILVKHGLKRPSAEHLAGAWVRTGDYLFDATTVEADFVIGNPPYVRLEDIPEEIATFYRDAYPTMRAGRSLRGLLRSRATPIERARNVRVYLRRPLDAKPVRCRIARIGDLRLRGGCRHGDAQCGCLP